MKTVSAITVAFHSEATLEACLVSVREAGVTETIVVDNGATPQARASATAQGATYLPQPSNQGFAAACNRGAMAARGDYLLFINPDALLSATSLTTAANFLTAHTNVGIVGLLLCDESGQPEPQAFGSAIGVGQLLWRKLVPSRTLTRPLACGWVSGGALLIRREVFWEVGGFDPAFFMYWEDVDLCYRVRQHDWRVVVVPAAPVRHQRGGSQASLPEKTGWYDASADRYFRKHYATPIWLLHRILRFGWRLVSPQVV